MNIGGTAAAFAAAMTIVSVTRVALAQDLPPNDYPTTARADYVYACMQVNGPTRDMLDKCSCSIDQIAAVLPYKDYEEAETIMSIIQKGGESVSPFRTPDMQMKVKNMKRAQVEGELRCF